MKLVTVEGARILDLVPTEEFRSRRGVYLPDFIAAIVERYGFTVMPTDPIETNKSGAKFENGRFFVEGETVAIKELSIYSDGVICDCYDSDYADMALDDFYEWATEHFGFQTRTSPVRRTYTSALVCEFDKEVEAGLGKLGSVCDLLSKTFNEAYGLDYRFNLNRLAFNVDPRTIPHLRATTFSLERRVQTPYTENRYFAVAPLKTKTHIELLQKIENQLLS